MTRWMRLRLVTDRVVAVLLLVLLGPLILFLMLVIRLHDGKPAVIAVPRIGKDGRPIRMWKLRSMRAERPDGMAEGVSLTTADDDRITPVGRRLRAYYLDELPQLWNVAKGEMILLGARPEALEYVDIDDPRWRHVLQVPPGMAGPTQLIVNNWERHLISECPDGRTYVTEVLPVKLAIDRWYIDGASLRVDLLVAVTLLRRFAPGTHTYTLKKRVLREVAEVRHVDDAYLHRERHAIPA